MDDLNNLDDTTALVVLQNWLGDVNHEIASRKRKRDDEDDTDADLQLVLTKNEVNSRIAFIADRAAARITAGEDAADYHDNNQVEDDRRDAPNDDPPNGDHPNDGPHNDVLPTAEANGVQLGINDPSICVCCHESFADDKLAQCPCEHKYCKECLEHLVEISLADTTSFPPRCCRQSIPVSDINIRAYLEPRIVGRYMAKKLEMDTPNRIYCHKPDCSLFIPPQGIRNEVGTCPRCRSKTCILCKGAVHDGMDCPEDEGGRQLLELAEQQGWKQCSSCHRVVELSTGCNHISKYSTYHPPNPELQTQHVKAVELTRLACRCSTEFCYRCEKVWKTCVCPLWDEARLLEHANEAVRDIPQPRHVWFDDLDPWIINPWPAQEVQPAPVQPAPRQPAPRQPAPRQPAPRQPAPAPVNLCLHIPHRWKHAQGPVECEWCGDLMEKWINKCRRCNAMVCGTCRHNRL